ncbi:MAG: hypothetical protein ACI84C_002802 [Flavobacteriales bacterium]|jgi:hypothetical protein
MKKNLTLFFILIGATIIAGIVFYLKGDETKSAGVVLNDFSIEDTSKVDRITIIDVDGRTVDLRRTQGEYLWDLNGKKKARKDATDLLLKTFRRIGVKGHIPQTAQENVVRMIAGSGFRVDIYMDQELSKSYLIGTCTQDHYGTYMVLEHGDGIRSAEPMIMHMDGFTGCLRQRFFTDESEWRFSGIFNYEDLDISRIDLENHENPLESFTIKYQGGNNIDLHPFDSPEKFPRFDTLAVKNYMLLFKKVHLETYNNHLSENGLDSLSRVNPAFTVKVTDNSGASKKVDLFWKLPTTEQLDYDGNIMPWDGDRMYGKIMDETVLVQRYTFDPIMQSIRTFLY